MEFFQPNPAQQRWIDEISKPGAFIVINAAGNGSGKTYGLVSVLGGFIWPNLRIPCFSTDTFQQFKYPKRARIVSTPKELEEVGSLQTTIAELWPRKRYEPNKKGKSYYSQFITDTGWVIDLMSYEQERTEFAGPNLGLIFFNEPMPRPIWEECLMRTRSGGLILPVMTSLSEEPWVVDELLGKADGKDIRVVYGDIEDNCKEHTKTGTLSHEMIDRILSKYDPDEREARKTGKPLTFSGRIFKTFDRSVHVVSHEKISFEGELSHFMVVDPAVGKPLACLWAYADSAGFVTVYDEWPEFDFEGSKDSNLAVSDYVKLFKDRERGKHIETRILDRHFGNRRQTLGGKTLKEELAEAGMEFFDSYNIEEEVETGILRVKEYLKYNSNKPIDSLNRPRLRVSDKCRNTIAALERWTRDPRNGKPRENYKDFADVIRYLVMSEPKYEPRREWGEARMPHYGVGTI